MINYLFKEQNWQTQNWQTQLTDLVTDPIELLQLLRLDPAIHTHLAQCAQQQFKLRVPRQYVAKIKPADPNDPLLLQVLPHHLELDDSPEFVSDPLQEWNVASHSNATVFQSDSISLPAGMLHKYHSRVLLTLTGACAIHCRYCFRRHYPYHLQHPKSQQWQQLADYVRAHPRINEVILSGGDPLTLSNAKLDQWLTHIESLPQITIVRLHSRVPVVIPQRIDQTLIKRLAQSRLRVILVVHVNHPNELDEHFDDAMQQLQRQHIVVLNQSVLLKGINDNIATLSALSYRLLQAAVLPYYLHCLDKVTGAAHFLVDDQTALTLYHDLLEELPGYLVPRLVREIAGELHKTPVIQPI